MVEFLAEILFELFSELLFAGLVRKRGGSWKPSAAIAVFCSLALGAIAGGLSLGIVSEHLIHDERLRVANVVLAPVFGWGAAALFVRAKKKRGKEVYALERGTMGALVAFSVALVRWLFAE